MDEEFQTFDETSEESQQQQQPPTQPIEKEPSVEEVDPRTLLTQEQVDYFKQIFDSFDVQKKGKITTKAIGVALRMMGLNPTKAQIKAHIEEVDVDKKGLIDFPRFLLPLAQRIDEEAETAEEIIAAFKALADEEESDYITTDQLTEYMTTLAEDLEDYEIETLIKTAETKGTGLIYYQEFVERLMGLKKVAKPKKGGKNKKKKKKK